MSETTSKHLPLDQNAPLPWLANKEDAPQTPAPSWKLTGHGDVLLEVSFPYHASDYRRCFTLLNAFRWHIFAIICLPFGLIVASFAVFLTYLSRNPPPRVVLFFLVFLGTSIGMFFLIGQCCCALRPL